MISQIVAGVPNETFPSGTTCDILLAYSWQPSDQEKTWKH